MDRYVKGLLTAYDRVLNLIELLDPTGSDVNLICLKTRIEASLYAYKLFTKQEELDILQKELAEKYRNLALEGSLTADNLVSILKTFAKENTGCKIISLPPDYFNELSK